MCEGQNVRMCESRGRAIGRGDISELACVEICIPNASTRRARLRPNSDRGSESPLPDIRVEAGLPSSGASGPHAPLADLKKSLLEFDLRFALRAILPLLFFSWTGIVARAFSISVTLKGINYLPLHFRQHPPLVFLILK
jgi:hypothetical protein